MMIYYRLSLLILICLSYLSCPSVSLANSNFFTLDVIAKKEKKIAQGVTNNSQDTASDPSLDYDQAMQAGYKATEEKDYETAQTQFRQALQARPTDPYAQQALHNVEFYLAQQSNPLSNLNPNTIILWVGLGIILIGIAVGIWLFLRRSSVYSQDKLEEELLQPHKLHQLESQISDNKDLEKITPSNFKDNSEDYEDKQEPKTPLFSSDNKPVKSQISPEVIVETPESEEVLSIQKTTRIPSRDPVETLIDQLQEDDPKKRRQAIWKLAQTADSRAMKSLVDLMINTDSQERSLILEALSQISTRTLKPMNHALTLSLQDKNPQVRKNAIRDLTRIHELMSQIYQLLCHAMDDSDREVQETAKWAINQLNTQIPPRLDMMTDENTSEVTVEHSYSDTIE